MNWRDAALCRNDPNPERWFPENYDRGEDVKQVCGPCPVRMDCLVFALVHRLHGVWGGTTTRDRERMGVYPSWSSPSAEQNRAIRVQAVEALFRAGESERQIGIRLGMTLHAVSMLRHRHRPRGAA